MTARHDPSGPGLIPALIAAAALAAVAPAAPAAGDDSGFGTFANPSGRASSYSTLGAIDVRGAFFADLGTNGRTCNTCHLESDGWSVSARTAQALFEKTGGLDPLFLFDGQDREGADRSSVEARRRASSLMLSKGLVRTERPPGGLRADAEFEIAAREQTYGNPTTDPATGADIFVVFRRMLPTTNFGALATVGWDGVINAIAPVHFGVESDDVDGMLGVVGVLATMHHAQTATPPTAAQVQDMVSFMRSLTSAQVLDRDAKSLTARGALGGPGSLARLAPSGPPGFTIFDAWQGLDGPGVNAARGAVFRGQVIFNAREFEVTGVAGRADGRGTCAGCHRAPNLGSGARMLAIGTAGDARRSPDLPLYTLRRKADLAEVKVSDPGLAAITGKWDDIGRFKVPALRALAARAPYFHNGSAATLDEVVDFYDARFGIGLTAQERRDLAAFLRSL